MGTAVDWTNLEKQTNSRRSVVATALIQGYGRDLHGVDVFDHGADGTVNRRHHQLFVG